MRRSTLLSRCLVLVMCLCVAFPGAVARAQSNSDDLRYARSLSRAFETAASGISPSVVHITTQAKIQRYRQDFFGRRVYVGPPTLEDTGLGSGVIIDKDGLILTNNHVIAEADSLVVKLYDGREISDVEVVGADEATDLAVLRINAPDLVAAKFGDSDTLRVGEWVLAMGSPFGFDSTVTAGIVSAKGRSLNPQSQEASYQEYIQTDAAINPGNSGGPLINLEGEVVGINAAIISRTRQSAGLGFAIPSVVAQRVVDSIVKSGRVERGFLGVYMADLEAGKRHELGLEPDEGVLITGVQDNSPASGADLKEGDIILKINGRAVIGGLNRVRNLISLSAPGSELMIQVLRGNDRVVKHAVLGDPTSGLALESGGEAVPELGVVVQPMTPEKSKDLGYRRTLSGLYVVKVADGTPAASAGIEEGDILTDVDNQPVDSTGELKDRLDHSMGDMTIELVRGRMRGYVQVRLN
ncbi:MAG: trypsin-like peptidase domain-containing protein [Phycisphaeraceae bacterium]|nr:MAG: trypsin-like peptidase domain-containing protein [Phycisphaeraceae bacterium]